MFLLDIVEMLLECTLLFMSVGKGCGNDDGVDSEVMRMV